MDVQIVCPCPPKGDEVRHPQGDTITLRDKLDYTTVTVIRKAMQAVDDEDDQVRFARQLAAVTEFYMLLGISSWTLTDAKGKAMEPTRQAIRDLFERADILVLSEAAERLYNPVVLLPLVNLASASMQPTPTPSPESEPSTLVTSIRPSPLKPSKRSSTITSPTDATEMTSSSLDGASNSSQNSVSAA